MKKIRNLLFIALGAIILVGFIGSCKKEIDIVDEIDSKLIFNDLNVNLPKGHSEKELYLTKDDYMQIIKIKRSSLKSNEEEFEYSLYLMDSLCNKVLENYPIIDSIIEFEKIRFDFPNLSDEQIINSIETIDSFYNCLIRYDLANEINKCNFDEFLQNRSSSKHKSGYLGTDLNNDEFWFIFYHARFTTPIKTATNLALHYTNSYFPSSSQYQDIADAYRHAVWSAFICRESASKCEWVSECQDIAKGFTDAHESGSTKPEGMTDADYALDKNMDLHNNYVGRYYFGTIAYSYKRCWLCDRYVKSASVETVAGGVYAYVSSAVKVTTKAQMDSNSTSLVYLK
jgi:hypothetical protein